MGADEIIVADSYLDTPISIRNGRTLSNRIIGNYNIVPESLVLVVIPFTGSLLYLQTRIDKLKSVGINISSNKLSPLSHF